MKNLLTNKGGLRLHVNSWHLSGSVEQLLSMMHWGRGRWMLGRRGWSLNALYNLGSLPSVGCERGAHLWVLLGVE